MLNYTDITRNIYIQSQTVSEMLARKKCGRRVVLHTAGGQLTLLGDVFYHSLSKHAAVASS
jgi:hypothetical protein